MELNYTPYKLNPDVNISDPHVVFDQSFERTPVKRYILDEMANNSTAVDPRVDTTRVEGVIVPLIKINSQVITTDDLISMRLNAKEFIPTIEVIVAKADYIKLGTPGMVNKITVILVPTVDGVYNKISIDFDITSVNELPTSYRYTGSFFSPDLYKCFTKCIKHDGKNAVTTYELFYEIAKNSKLGYAVTDEVESINDTKIRLMRNQTYKDVILEHIRFSGLDENSFFKTWIDLYGYLNLCNVAWVMSLKTGAADYSMHNESGINFTDPTATLTSESIPGEESPTINATPETFRTITNWRINEAKVNNQIEAYEWLIDNSFIKTHGTDNMYYTVNHVVTGGSNSITSERIVITDDSAEGKLYPEYYLCQKNKFIGVEMASEAEGNTPVLYQEKRRSSYFAKLNSKKLKVTMMEPNYALDKGIMIQVSIFEFERNLKAEMLRNTSNTSEEGDNTGEVELNPEDKEKYLNNVDFGILNTAISGMYFIDGIEYIYNTYDKEIKQILYLIKRGDSMAYINAASKTKVSLE